MLREEAEHEAARRNLEDPERERFEFYAFDESAGLAEDAWAVGARLPAEAPSPPEEPEPRSPPRPAVLSLADPEREPAAAPEPEPAAAPEPEPGATVEWSAEADWLDEPVPEPEPVLPPLRPGRPEPEPRRPGRFVRALGALTMVVGMLWMAMIVLVAVLLRPDDVPALALYLGAAALGLVAIAVGVAIRRS